MRWTADKYRSQSVTVRVGIIGQHARCRERQRSAPRSGIRIVLGDGRAIQNTRDGGGRIVVGGVLAFGAKDLRAIGEKQVFRRLRVYACLKRTGTGRLRLHDADIPGDDITGKCAAVQRKDGYVSGYGVLEQHGGGFVRTSVSEIESVSDDITGRGLRRAAFHQSQVRQSKGGASAEQQPENQKLKG